LEAVLESRNLAPLHILEFWKFCNFGSLEDSKFGGLDVRKVEV
jgi:hypothetical protein